MIGLRAFGEQKVEHGIPGTEFCDPSRYALYWRGEISDYVRLTLNFDKSYTLYCLML